MNDYSSMNAYFKSIKDFAPLNKKEEQELIVLYKTKKDLKARNKIIVSNIKFVIKVVLTYKNPPLPFADLFNEGVMGLLRALESYEVSRNLKFISYAVWWVKAYCNRAINEKGNIIKHPRKNKDSRKNEDSSKNEFYNIENILSLDMTIKNSDFSENNLKNCVFDDSDKELINHVENIKLKKIIEEFLKELTDIEKYILLRVYGLKGYELSLGSIGENLNLSKERIRQIKVGMLKKLKKKYSKHYREIIYS